MIIEIRKKLSANDIGTTGTHQSGILVPKEQSVLKFFPVLDRAEKNPRMTLPMREHANDTRWDFNFIYYNNRLFGGTRNEYRLTCMTGYLRAVDAKVGDEIVFTRDANASYVIDLVRLSTTSTQHGDDGVLVLSGGWKVINLHKQKG
jgi:hypothetical protein